VPITITVGQPLDHIGPGLQANLQSSFIGPLPIGSKWDVIVSAQPEGAAMLWHETWLANSPSTVHWWLTNPQELEFANTGAVGGGTTVYVTAQLFSGNSVVDTGSINRPFDATAGLGQQAALVASHASAQSGGMTPTQAQQLQETWDWVHRDLQTAVGTVLSTGLGPFIAHPDANLLNRHTPAFFLSGAGVLTGLSPTGFAGLYGIAWGVSEHPPGAGIGLGSIGEWQLRVVQFVPQYTDALTGEFVTPEVVDSKLDQFYWLWQRALPARVLYTVTPGFVLRCQWIGIFG
jgi:hypothetical protein